jgi:hypothetical protein
MTQQQKKAYNYENENDYHFAPFSDARAGLRKVWNQTRKNWDSFLYDQEKKFQQSKIN